MQMSKVEYALSEAQGADEVIIICFDSEGEMSMHSTITRGPDILWSLELAKLQVLEMGQPEDA
jgi:hypothetical protein